ncbi:MAG TPA: hypothetical protein VIO32_07415 [Candidatus Baltobacteraceae bacterium]
MKLFGDVGMIRGTVAWRRPWRVRFEPAAAPKPPEPAAPEFDEEGRLYVFRYARPMPQQYSIERDRIFEYMKKRRLPDAGQRQIRRDFRNRADFFTEVRELQTPLEVSPLQ